MSVTASAVAAAKNPRNAAAAAILAALIAVLLATWSRPDARKALGDAAARGIAGFDSVATMIASRSPGDRPDGALASLKAKRLAAPHERALAKIRPVVPNTLADIVAPPTASPIFAPPFTPTPLENLLGSPTIIPAATPIPGGPPGGFPAITPGGGGLIVPPIGQPSPPVPPGTPTPSVPEPGTWAMMLIGFLLIGRRVRRSMGLATRR